MFKFNDFVGNAPVVDCLRGAIARGTPAHAYIVDGAPGSGKTTLVNTAAKAMQCLEKKADPCGVCVSCRTFTTMNHPDVFRVVPTKTKSVGVDDVREQIVKNIGIKPYKYPYKVFLIENAHSMTPAAQNAFLKTLEEPADYGVFFLTSENTAGFLPTVLSRSVVLRLKPLADNIVEDCLIKNGFTRGDAAKYSAYAGGSVGRALKLKDDETFAAAREIALDIVSRAGDNNETDTNLAFRTAARCEPLKEDIRGVLQVFYALHRDVLVVKATNDISRAGERERRDIVGRAAEKTSVKNILMKLDAIARVDRGLIHNANFAMSMDTLMMELHRRT